MTSFFEGVLISYPAHYVALGFMTLFAGAVFAMVRLGPLAVIGEIYRDHPVFTVTWTLMSPFATCWFVLVAIRGFSAAIGQAVGWL